MNQELYNKFLNVAAVLTKKDEVSEEIEYLKGKRNQLIKQLSNAEKKPQTAGRQYLGKIIGGKILSFTGFITSALFFLEMVAFLILILIAPIINSDVDLGDPLLIGVLFLVTIMTVGFLIMGISGIRLVKTGRKNQAEFKVQSIKDYEKAKSELEPKIATIEKEIADLEKQFSEYKKAIVPYFDFLPHTYHNLHAVGFMLSALENLRADNLTAVINLYEQELHHLEQMRVLNQTAEMQRIHNENMRYAMESVQRNQDRINSNLQNIQMLQIIDILND